MAKRIPWDEYEAAYLLDNCIKIENGELSEKEAIPKISRNLRARAISLGMKIDDKFRNEAGIRMQLAAMRECYFGRISGLAMGKIFKETVEIYKERPEDFEEILRSNKKRLGEKKRLGRSQFLAWLQNEKDSNKVQNIRRALDGVNTLARFKKIVKKSIFEISDIKEVEKLKILVRDTDFGIRGKKRIKKAVDSLELYCKFLTGAEYPKKEESIKINEGVMEEDNKGIEEGDPQHCTFKEWLIGINLNKHTVRSYVYAIKICEQMATEYNLPSTKIYGVSEDKAKLAISLLQEEKGFVEENNRQHHRLSAALAKYEEYISSENMPLQVTSGGKKPKDPAAINEIEEYLRSVNLKGATVGEIVAAVQPNAAVYATANALGKNMNIINMSNNISNGRYVHVDCFTDLDVAEKQMGSILRRHFGQFNGYSNNRLLFDAASHELSMFLNDNDCADSDSVYAIARFLFEKRATAGKAYVFSHPHIFERKIEDPTLRGLMVSLARRNGGILELSDTKEYLQKTKIQYTVQYITQIGTLSLNNFLIYDSDRYILSETLNIDKDWCKYIHDSLDDLFKQANIAYVIPRQINPLWFNNLPKLPEELPWTNLLLQEIIKKYPDVGFKVISPDVMQDNDTLAAAFVPIGSPIQSFPDLVVLFVSEYHELPVKIDGKTLRLKLRDAGMLQGGQLSNIIHKALDDSRFAWSNNNRDVRISK